MENLIEEKKGVDLYVDEIAHWKEDAFYIRTSKDCAYYNCILTFDLALKKATTRYCIANLNLRRKLKIAAVKRSDGKMFCLFPEEHKYLQRWAKKFKDCAFIFYFETKYDTGCWWYQGNSIAYYSYAQDVEVDMTTGVEYLLNKIKENETVAV